MERILKIDSGMSMDYYMPKKGDAPDLLTTEEMFKTETLILQGLVSAFQQQGQAQQGQSQQQGMVTQ